jgi:hypothetical protein
MEQSVVNKYFSGNYTPRSTNFQHLLVSFGSARGYMLLVLEILLFFVPKYIYIWSSPKNYIFICQFVLDKFVTYSRWLRAVASKQYVRVAWRLRYRRT